MLSSVFRIPLPEGTSISEPESSLLSVLVIDAMCIVNMVSKTPGTTNAMHYGRIFVDIVAGLGASYDEIRVVLYQYLPGSLKETTREKRTSKRAPIQYHVNDDTEIKNMKNFFSHISTKAELNKYLSDKLISYYKGKS